MKYITNYHNAPIKILEEADILINEVLALVGDSVSHWSLSINGLAEDRRNEAKKIVLRAKLLEQLVKERTSR
jgi:hypothetical protein